MVGCRKIYCNLLLLSVMLFLLGGAVRPSVPGWEWNGAPFVCAAAEKTDFQWEEAGAPLVYRSECSGGMLSATATELLTPERQAELCAPAEVILFYDFSEPLPGVRFAGLRASRAPPEAAD